MEDILCLVLDESIGQILGAVAPSVTLRSLT